MERDFTQHEKEIHQKRILEILIHYKAICEKHELTYYLTAGTLLGAIRHGGFIPWDDDIDVVMPRADFQKFSKIAQKELGSQYFFQSSETDEKYPFYFSKIRRNNTEVFEPHLKAISIHKGEYIDIFPLDICPERIQVATIYFKAIELIMVVMLAKGNKKYKCGYTKWYMRALYRFLGILPRRLLRKLREILRCAVEFLCVNNRLCTVNGAHGYPRESYDIAWFGTTEYRNFEGIQFPIPGGWHEILSNMYGDYMTIPPMSGRTDHLKKKEDERK